MLRNNFTENSFTNQLLIIKAFGSKDESLYGDNQQDFAYKKRFLEINFTANLFLYINKLKPKLLLDYVKRKALVFLYQISNKSLALDF